MRESHSNGRPVSGHRDEDGYKDRGGDGDKAEDVDKEDEGRQRYLAVPFMRPLALLACS